MELFPVVWLMSFPYGNAICMVVSRPVYLEKKFAKVFLFLEGLLSKET